MVPIMRLIEMPCVGRARRIARIVQLQIEQTKRSLAIQRKSQGLEARKQRRLGHAQRRRQPTNGIATDLLAALRLLACADTRRGEFAARETRLGARPQAHKLGGIDKAVLHAYAVTAKRARQADN